nr:FAD-binding oxidoreductase [Piscinibacter sakaiensis]
MVPGAAVPPAQWSDWSGEAGERPLVQLRPASTEEVAWALRWCHARRLPVVPQGGRTGLAGGAALRAGAVALSLERMAVIDWIDPVVRLLQVQAGATLQQVHDAAEAAGLAFGVDLGARGSCQVGGAVSTNAGGHGVLQHGMMREQVLGLEVVLADGEVLPMLRPMPKNNTGVDLKHLFIGAEGTLGIVTRALLRLHPRAEARATALLALHDYAQAPALLAALQARLPGAVAAFELMWRDFLEAALDWRGGPPPFAALPPLCALVDVQGPRADVQAALQQALEAAFAEGLADDAVLAHTEAQARALWRLREATAEFPARLHDPVNFDVALPMRRIGDFAEACLQALDADVPGHRSLRFGHVGDGNLHLSTDGASVLGRRERVEQVVYAQVAAFEGSVSAEHGIGLHKKAWLALSRSPAELAAMRRLKQALDPLGLMNPGKLLDAADPGSLQG